MEKVANRSKYRARSTSPGQKMHAAEMLKDKYLVFSSEILASVPTSIGKDTSHWSFSKAERFRLKKPEYSADYVTLPSTLNNTRTTSFGFGRRSDMKSLVGRDSPPPTTYSPPSIFDINKNHAPSFGPRPTSNSRGTKVYKDIPGPGSYNPVSGLGRDSPKFSFRPRIEIKKTHDIPPPNAYTPSYNVTERSNYSAITFGYGKRSEQATPNKETPGPGSYDLPSLFRSSSPTKSFYPRSSFFNKERSSISFDEKMTPS
jgi:hypothetical protein